VVKYILMLFLATCSDCFGQTEFEFSTKVEDVQRVLNEGSRSEIYLFFAFLDRGIRTGKWNHEEKIDIAKILYLYRHDKREEVEVSEDEVAGSVQSEVLGAMVKLTDYRKGIWSYSDNKDPFQPHPNTGPVISSEKSRFFEWFEEGFLDGESDSNQQLRDEDAFQPEQAIPSANEIAPTYSNRELESSKFTSLYWVLSVSTFGLFVIYFFVRGKGKQ